MSQPEGLQPKQRNFAIELNALLRKGILEGVIDPQHGTNFTVVQNDELPPFASLERIAAFGREVMSVGIPNPLSYEFDELVLSDEEKQEKDQQASDRLDELGKDLGQEEE